MAKKSGCSTSSLSLRQFTHIPSNDFSLYDHVLDTSVMVGAIPEMAGAGLLFCHGAPQKIITARLMERVDMT